MTARNLFSIILKVLALFFIRDFLALLPQLFSLLSLTSESSGGEFMSPVIAMVLSMLAYGLVAYLLLFQTEWVIGFLRMERGFTNEKLQLNIHRSIVLTIAVIIIGALMILNAVPDLLGQLFLYMPIFRSNGDYYPGLTTVGNSEMAIYITEIILGFLILRYQRSIVNFIEYKSRKKKLSKEKVDKEMD